MIKKILFPKIEDNRGNLTFIEDYNQIPFKIVRLFWTYDVPSGHIRGGHAYKKQNEVVICLSGSFDINYYENGKLKKLNLNRSNFGVLIQPKTWRYLDYFSTTAISLHLTDREFSDEDYISNFKYIK